MTPRADNCAFWSILSLSCLIGLLVLIRSAKLNFSTIAALAKIDTVTAEPAATSLSTPKAGVDRPFNRKSFTTARVDPERVQTTIVRLDELPTRIAVRRGAWSDLEIPPERVVGIKFTLRVIEVRRKPNDSDFLYRHSNSPPRLSTGLKLRNPLEKLSNKPDTYWFEKGTRHLGFRSADTRDEDIEIIWRQ